MAQSYTSGTNLGVKVNWVGQGGIVGRRTPVGKTHGKERHMERLIREDFIGKTNREDYSAHLLICQMKPY
jgi:hypothetical protein